MTTIFKVSDQERISPTLEKMESAMQTPRVGDGRKFASSLDESGLADECERLEKCASSGEDYAYFAGWPQEQISQLKEYAAVVGFKGQMVAVRQAEEVIPDTTNDDAHMQALAAIPSSQPKVSADLSLAVGDPFHLTDISDAPKGKDNWEQVVPERKLASQPHADARSGSIMPLRGEYDYGTSQTLRVRPGENSVANPDAIGKLAQEEDTGARLKAEAAQRKIESKASKTIWQQEAIQQAKAMGPGSLSRGTVILASDAAPKLADSGLDFKAAMSELGQKVVSELPDLTEGEQLHQSADQRKTAIQRKAEKDDWQKVKGTTRPSLTDAFADALEFQLQKVAGVKQPVKTAQNANPPQAQMPPSGKGQVGPGGIMGDAIAKGDVQTAIGYLDSAVGQVYKDEGTYLPALKRLYSQLLASNNQAFIKQVLGGMESTKRQWIEQNIGANAQPAKVASATADQTEAFMAALEAGLKKIKKI